MSEVISDIQIEQLEKIIELKNQRIHILAKKLETREQQLGKMTKTNIALIEENKQQVLQLKEAESVIDSLEDNLLHELNYSDWLEIKSELAGYRKKYKTNE
jgi:molecular chaperone DnaK (HSP70)